MSEEIKPQVLSVEFLLQEWEKDAVIDDTHLDKSSTQTAIIHSKYLNYYIKVRERISVRKRALTELTAAKYKYFQGEMTREELLERNWTQYQGLRVPKSEMERVLSSDKQIGDLKMKLENLENMLLIVESIMQQIKGRDWQIRNAITYKQFLNGQ